MDALLAEGPPTTLKTNKMDVKAFDTAELLKYGSEIEMSGILMGNGNRAELLLFPETSPIQPVVRQLNHEEWKVLLNQLDTLGVMGLNKVILRKSQRNIDTKVSWRVFRRDDFTCQYCAADNVPMTVDHIIRWENMGASVEDNLICSCAKCNKTRGDTEFEEWLHEEYFNDVLGRGFTKGAPQQLFKLLGQYELAKKVPLRNTQRNR